MAKTDTSEIGRSGLIILLGTALSMLSGFVFKISLSNFLPGTVFGSIMLATSLFGILSIPTVLGLNEGVVKYVSATNDTDEKGTYIFISIILVGLVSTIIVFVFLLFLKPTRTLLFDNKISNVFFILFLFCIPFHSLTKIIKGGLHGIMDTNRYTGFSQVFQPLSRLILAVGAALVIGTGQSVIGGILLAYIFTVIFGIILLYKSGIPFSYTKNVDIKSMITFSLPLAISSSVYILLTRIDRVLIGYYMSPFSVGVYEVGMTIAMLLGLFHSAFSFLLFPKISELDSQDMNSKIPQMYGQTTKWILTCTTPAFLILLMRPNFLIQLFGTDYSVSTIRPILVIISIGFFVDAIVGPNGQALLGFGKSKKVLYYNSIAVIANIGLNIILIPSHGLLGAATASLVGYLIMNIIKSVDLYYYHNIAVVNYPGIKMMVGGMIFTSIVIHLTNVYSLVIEFVFLSIVGIFSIAISFLVLFLSGDLTEDDKKLLRKVIPK